MVRALSILTFLVAVHVGAAVHAADVDPPVIEHAPLRTIGRAAPFEIRATIRDASAVFAPTVYWRIKGETEFRSQEMSVVAGKDGMFLATLSTSVAPEAIEYFVEAFDEHGNGPTRVGNPSAPFSVALQGPVAAGAKKAPQQRPEEFSLFQTYDEEGKLVGRSSDSMTETQKPADREPSNSVFKKWWFWGLVGGVAVAGAGTFVLVNGGSGGMDIVVQGPSPVGL